MFSTLAADHAAYPVMPRTTHRTLSATVAPGDAGQRLDRFLAGRWPELSRTRLQALLEAGAVERDGVLIAEGSARVKPGQTFVARVDEPRPARPQPEDLPLDVLFEDEHLLVLEKPAGMVVHPAPGHAGGTLVNALLAHCQGSLSGIGGVLRPGIVHRLDKEVSGLMVVAKGDRAHVGLAGQFSVRRIERGYDAIVWGVPPQPAGSIEGAIGRHARDRKRMAVVEGGKPALTRYRLRAAAGTLGARLGIELATGRTHQIRVHLGMLGLGIVGDPVYRPRRRPAIGPELREFLQGFGRIALHAHLLGFEHPVSGERLRFERAPPAAFDALFELLARQAQPSSFVNHKGVNPDGGTLQA
ncbi:MAG TPA: RluA family pseudouridine synthase [Geminicoccaceae bacterium]|nr:RluA family pseudouridine synthase [Geminicoccaceae bacterium]